MNQFLNDPRNAPGASDEASRKRSATRDSLLLTAQLKIDEGAAAQVRIRNLSAGGLMAEHPAPVPIGTPVAIDVRGVGWVSGRVAWCTDGRVGIAFDQPINPKLARKPVGQGTHTPVYAKPILPLR